EQQHLDQRQVAGEERRDAPEVEEDLGLVLPLEAAGAVGSPLRPDHAPVDPDAEDDRPEDGADGELARPADPQARGAPARRGQGVVEGRHGPVRGDGGGGTRTLAGAVAGGRTESGGEAKVCRRALETKEDVLKKKLAPVATLAAAALALSGAAVGGNQAKPTTFTAALNVGQEIPHPKGTKAGAAGKFAATLTGSTLKWRLTFTHLSGAAAAAHIHAGKKGKSGAVLVPLCGPCSS